MQGSCSTEVTFIARWLYNWSDILQDRCNSMVTFISRWLYYLGELYCKVAVLLRWPLFQGDCIIEVTSTARWLCYWGDFYFKVTVLLRFGNIQYDFLKYQIHWSYVEMIDYWKLYPSIIQIFQSKQSIHH